MDKVAVITGASAGLGVHFAHALATEGHAVLLIARRGDRLDALAAEIRARHGVRAESFPFDLSRRDAPAAVVAALAERGMTANLLINNAGFGASGPFIDVPVDRQQEMIDLNCTTLVGLCHALLPPMIARGRGGILNVASTAAFQPGPWMSIYFASKAFVLSFSEALHEEVKAKGVRVSALCPGPTRSEFGVVAGTGDTQTGTRRAAAPEGVIRAGLDALNANRAVKITGFMNGVMAQSIRFLPRGVARRAAGAMFKRLTR